MEVQIIISRLVYWLKTSISKLTNAVFLFISSVLFSETLSAQSIIVENQYSFSLPVNRGYSNTFAYVDEVRQEYLRGFFDRVNQLPYIDVYDLESGRLKTSIQLKGLEALTSFFRTEKNDIWVFDESRRYFVLFNSSGDIEKEINEGNHFDIQGPYTSYYGDMDFNPLVLYNDKLFLVSSLLSVSGRNSDISLLRKQGMLLTFDLKRETFKWEGQVPASLISHDYGYLNRFSTTIKDNNLVIAPFFSNEIMIYGLESANYIYPIVDSSYYKIAKPFSILRDNPKSLKENNAANTHYFANPHYIGILYDKYKNVYYRIMNIPSGRFNKMSMKIVLLDEYFRYKSIYDIPEKYVHKGMFVTEKGLNILNHSKYQSDSGVLVFDTFTFN